MHRGPYRVLAAFTAAQGYSAHGDYSPRAWLINRTGVTRGAAVGYTAWVRRSAAHPQIAAALAAGEMSESVARTFCLWTGKLPGERREDADEILADAAVSGLGLGDLAGLFAEIYDRYRPDKPDEDQDQSFEDRAISWRPRFGGAGCAARGPDPGVRLGGDQRCWTRCRPRRARRTPAAQEQRFHDALQEAMRWL